MFNKAYILIDSNFLRGDSIAMYRLWHLQDKIKKAEVDLEVEYVVCETVLSEVSSSYNEMLEEHKRTVKKLTKNFYKAHQKNLPEAVTLSIEEQLESAKVIVLKDDIKGIELHLEDIVEKARNAKPPFERVSKSSDKGFKDAVISITYWAKANKESAALIIVVTDDQIMKEYLNELKIKHKQEKRIRVLSEINDIVETITTANLDNASSSWLMHEKKVRAILASTELKKHIEKHYTATMREELPDTVRVNEGSTSISLNVGFQDLYSLTSREMIEGSFKISKHDSEIKVTKNTTKEVILSTQVKANDSFRAVKKSTLSSMFDIPSLDLLTVGVLGGSKPKSVDKDEFIRSFIFGVDIVINKVTESVTLQSSIETISTETNLSSS